MQPKVDCSVAVCCRVLQCVAVCCSVLQCVAVRAFRRYEVEVACMCIQNFTFFQSFSGVCCSDVMSVLQ